MAISKGFTLVRLPPLNMSGKRTPMTKTKVVMRVVRLHHRAKVGKPNSGIYLTRRPLISFQFICSRDGMGRHKGLKNPRVKPCRFESGREHQNRDAKVLTVEKMNLPLLLMKDKQPNGLPLQSAVFNNAEWTNGYVTSLIHWVLWVQLPSLQPRGSVGLE